MRMELQFLDLIQTMHTPVVDRIMCFITRLGDAGILWIVLAVILLVIPKTRKTGILLAGALCVDVVLCNVILKHLVGRIRPCDVNQAVELLIARPHDYSFPSGHTAASFAAVTALYLAGEKRLWIPALIVAVLIAFSRMYLYVHYPTDIIGGILCGIASGCIALWLLRKGMARWQQDVY